MLVGDFPFSRAFEVMVEDGSLKVLKILSTGAAVIAEGEVMQLSAQRRIETSEDQYLAIINAKTAELFAAACKIAAVVAERDEATEAALDAYGRNLGIAFQLVDDAIDYVSDAETMGKATIFATARSRCPSSSLMRAAAPKNAFYDHRTPDAGYDLAHATRRCASMARPTIRWRARHYGQRAVDAIGGFRASHAKAALTEAVAPLRLRGLISFGLGQPSFCSPAKVGSISRRLILVTGDEPPSWGTGR